MLETMGKSSPAPSPMKSNHPTEETDGATEQWEAIEAGIKEEARQALLGELEGEVKKRIKGIYSAIGNNGASETHGGRLQELHRFLKLLTSYQHKDKESDE